MASNWRWDYINLFTQDTTSKSHTMVITLYSNTFVCATDCCCGVYKPHWINTFRQNEDSFSFLMINRKTNCVLFLYLNLMFTFPINASLLMALLVFRPHSVLRHSLPVGKSLDSLLDKCHTSEENRKLKQLNVRTDNLGGKYGAEL